MERVVDEGAAVLAGFVENGVSVIRVGLQSSVLLTEGSETASPYHEATGELIYARYFRNTAEKTLSSLDGGSKDALIYVAPGEVSKMVGQKKANIAYLKEKFGLYNIKVRESEELSQNKIKITLEERKTGK